MKRTELETLGLSKEQVDAVMAINGTDIEVAKKVNSTELDTLKNQVDSLQTTISERNKQLETLKASTGDVEAMKKQIETLQTDNKAKDEAHATEMQRLKLDVAVEKVLAGAKAKNVKAVKALLDLEDAKFDKDGNVKGLAEQIEKISADEGTKFLFDTQDQQQQQTFKGFQPGASGSVKPGTKVDMSKMSYDEICAYLEQNPDAQVD
jgi:Phage minor structural protein GP20.